MPFSLMKARAYYFLKLNSVIYSRCYLIGKLELALKLFLGTGCSISRLKPSPGHSSIRPSRNTKNRLIASVNRSTGKQETKFTYVKATELPIALSTN
jgi:hypothetical protein